jgi:hypothetical protein
MSEEEVLEDRKYCPFRQAMCVGEKCMMWVTTRNSFVLGCAFPAMTVKLDDVEFKLRK